MSRVVVIGGGPAGMFAAIAGSRKWSSCNIIGKK